MKKLVKRVGVGLLVLLLLLAITALVGRSLFKGTPGFYRQYTWEPQRRSVLNQQAADKLLKTRQLAQQAHFGEVRAQRGSAGSAATTRPVSFTVTLTEEELNAFLFHNAETFREFKQKYQQYITNPGIFLENGRLILAAQSAAIGAVVSIQFDPSVTKDGELRIRLIGAYGGRLPLPQTLAKPYIDKLRGWIASRTPAWQSDAKLDRNGGFNASAVALAMSRLLVGALDDRPTDPILFMPVDEGETSVPLRVTAVAVKDRTLAVTLEPMPRAEREALFSRLKAPSANP